MPRKRLSSLPNPSRDTSARCSAYAHSDMDMALRRLAVLAIHAARAELVVVPAAAARDRLIRSLHRARPLPDVAGHVVGAERAARRGMRADLIGTERQRVAPVGHVDVGIVGRERAPARKHARIGAAGGAL